MDNHIDIIFEDLSVAPVEYKSMAFCFEVRGLCTNGQLFCEIIYIYFPS
jgi:hypothetical protein